MKAFKLTLIISMLVFISAEQICAQNFWKKVTEISVFPGDINCFAIDSNAVLYAGVDDGVSYESGRNGIFRSLDSGKTWENVALPVTPVYSIAIDNKGKVYAGATYGDLWSSSDTGKNWKHVNIGVPDQNIQALAIASNGRILAGTFGAGIYISADSGKTWVNGNNGITSLYIRALVVAPNGYIYAGTDFDGDIFLSTNSGSSWSLVDSGISTNAGIYTLSVGKDGNVYAGTYNGGVFVSQNKGKNWNQINNGFNTGVHINALINDSRNNIYAGTDNGVYISSNNGQTWNQTNNGIENTSTYINTILATPLKVFVGIMGGGIFISTDNGAIWVQSISANIDLINISSMTCDKAGKIYVGTNINGLFKSTDNGDNWEPANNGLTNTLVHSLTIDSKNNIYDGAYDQIFKSTDSGRHWTSTILDLPLSVLAIGPNDDIYAGAYLGNAVLFLSSDGGNNWNNVFNMDFYPSTIGVYGISVSSSGEIYIMADSGLYRTKDNGINWDRLIFSGDRYALMVNKNNVFLGSSGGIIRSTNDGDSWQQIDSGIANKNITCFSTYKNKIYAGTSGGGIYESNNNGLQWDILPSSGLVDLDINSLMIDSSGYLYALTDSGLFRAAETVTEVNGYVKLLPSWKLLQNYPNPCAGATTFTFSVLDPRLYGSEATVTLYNSLGTKVATIYRGRADNYGYTLGFDASALPAGNYYYRLECGGREETKMLTILK